VRGVVGHGTGLSDLHLPIRINGDLALFQAFGALLAEWDALDGEFVDEFTTGFAAWREHVDALDWDGRHRGDRAVPRADHRGRADAAAVRGRCTAGRWA
jgi:anaerobic selenocysteine-containing dehydrogenase